MALIQTEALILKSYNLAEADKIIVALTQTHGLVRGVAKGAKRLKSRFGGSLEPFTVVDLTIFEKEEKELVSIREIELRKSFFEQAANPNFLQKFAYLTEILINFAPPHEPNERLYRLIKVCLEIAAEQPESLDSIALYFEIWLLRLAGFLPHWDKCDSCRREFNDQEEASVQLNFHLHCQNCQKARGGTLISPEERKLFVVSQTISPTKFVELASRKAEQVREVSRIVKRIIAHVLGKESVGEQVLIAAQS